MSRATIRLRLSDKHASGLCAKARAVNFVWNFCNETQKHAVRWGRKWLTGYDLGLLTSGSSKELGLTADTIAEVCKQYGRSRQQRHRPWLKWRGKKSLGWIPFKKGTVRIVGHSLIYHSKSYTPLHWREFPEGAVILGGSFSQDARGRWYINCPVEMPLQKPAAESAVGIDLGLKDIATLSTGEKIGNPAHYRQLERHFAAAQRAHKARRAKAIAAKVMNSRRDYLHKASARIALNHSLIFVGDVSSKQLGQTRLAKSVFDAGWHIFKQQLTYKAMRHGGRCVEVNEAWTSRTCSCCGCIPDSSPKGMGALGVREWTCNDCGTAHDRDVNAARNILRLGRQSLDEGAARMRSRQP